MNGIEESDALLSNSEPSSKESVAEGRCGRHGVGRLIESVLENLAQFSKEPVHVGPELHQDHGVYHVRIAVWYIDAKCLFRVLPQQQKWIEGAELSQEASPYPSATSGFVALSSSRV